MSSLRRSIPPAPLDRPRPPPRDAAYRAALEETTRARVPLDWARTQTNLATALQTLGARESGTVRLEEAVAAYRAALEERTRARVPLDWARTQTNLGGALTMRSVPRGPP